MKKTDIFSAVQLFLAPVLVILLGLLLLINPDSASVLISKLLGGLLTVLAVGFGIAALFSDRRRAGKLILALALLACGSILSANPLLLASFAGRIVGLLLLMDGLGDMINAHRRGVRFLMPLIVTILGAVLVLMPMTASRLVFSLCGLAVTVIGIFMELDRKISLRLADKILSPGEKQQFDTAPDKRKALLTFWVLKEAAAKLSGEGLRGYPSHTDFSLDDPRVTEINGCLVAVMEE